MIRYTLIGVVAAAVALPALAAGPYDYVIGKRVEAKNTANGQASSTLMGDGTYQLNTTGADGKPVAMSGKWLVQGDKLCFEIDAAAHKLSCAAWGSHQVGDSFQITTDAGDTYDVRLLNP